MKHVYILTNGPGELWDWARPLAHELNQRGIRPVLWLLPCQYASGMERACAKSLPFYDVIGPYGWAKTFYELRKTKDVGLIVQLGGDLMFGRFLSKATNAELFCYTYGKKKGLSSCSCVFTAYEVMARNIESDGVYPIVIGDLVADSLKLDMEKKREASLPVEDSSSFKVAFFPGSRPTIRRRALPFLCEVYEHLSSILDADVVTLLSPFSFDEEVKIWEDAGLNPSKESTPVALKGVDLALTQPGTNTLELLYLKVPTLVAVPYVFLEDIPFSGLKRFIFRLPLVKTRLLKVFSENKRMLSWPNIIMGKELIPELVGDYTPRQIAEKMANYLCDSSWLKNISDLMSKFPSVRGASRRLTEEIIGCLP